MDIVPLGDSALIVRMRDRFNDASEQTLDTVLRVFQQLQNTAIPGVIELAPAYTSVAVFFDPISVAKEAEEPGKIFDWLAARIRAAVATGALSAVAVYSAEAAAKAGSAKADDRRRHRIATQRSVRLVEIPVCYDPEFAL